MFHITLSLPDTENFDAAVFAACRGRVVGRHRTRFAHTAHIRDPRTHLAKATEANGVARFKLRRHVIGALAALSVWPDE